MRRRLAVGCAMIGVPSVVILDEPTTGLDPVSRRGIWETIAEVRRPFCPHALFALPFLPDVMVCHLTLYG